MQELPVFFSCPHGVEALLAHEISVLGARCIHETGGGVSAKADLEALYRICLWSRLASRVLLPLQTFTLGDAETDGDAIYAAARNIEWEHLFDAASSFGIDVAGSTPGIANTHFARLRLKDAVVDAFRASGLPRPNVLTRCSDIRLHLYLERTRGTVSLDLAGDSLHRRGYRSEGGRAPLKENLACAVLARCGWMQNESAQMGRTAEVRSADLLQHALFDPMCGSGTFLIEAAWMAADIAPGLLRNRWGFDAWKGHQPSLWRVVVGEAQQRRRVGLARLPAIFHGLDLNQHAVDIARRNIDQAGLSTHVRVRHGDALTAQHSGDTPTGLVICNPPYGERLSNDSELVQLYSLFGATLKMNFGGWRCALLTPRSDLTSRLGLRASKINTLYNGPIRCKLLQFEIPATRSQVSPSAIAGDFSNRLRKNLRHLGRWAKRRDISCYRVYDADLPDYAVAVDLYHNEEGLLHVYVQEYRAPSTIDAVSAEKRLREILTSLTRILGVGSEQLHYRLRQPQKGNEQYQRQNTVGRVHTVMENGCRLSVNFDDYLDTGLFLDHRPMRLRLQHEAKGKRVLNLFSYTGSATVHAAVGGAKATVSIDLSQTYLGWAQRNLRLNGYSSWLFEDIPEPGNPLPRNCLIRADCRNWLRQQARAPKMAPFDLIFVDPPTFSNSKKMDHSFDVKRDHSELVNDAMALLALGGTLYFSANRNGFRLDAGLQAAYSVQDITPQTLDQDFRRLRAPHHCWAIRHRVK